MTKQEFLEGLRFALNGRIGASLITENVNYYDDYINTQVRMGRKEADVVRELGDPRLIAKSIAEANKHAGVGQNEEETYRSAEYSANTGYNNNEQRRKTIKMPCLVAGIIIVVIVFLLFSAAFSLLSFFMPIILPILLIGMVVNFFRRT